MTTQLCGSRVYNQQNKNDSLPINSLLTVASILIHGVCSLHRGENRGRSFVIRCRWKLPPIFHWTINTVNKPSPYFSTGNLHTWDGTKKRGG